MNVKAGRMRRIENKPGVWGQS